ncbi:DUF3833 domain-containing protein [Marinobacterium sp. D7]|uniref:DUF3833 domain-containing protein n=1 Tax=Marinobacterium ramblicola TaxID=2849041 RepID=UPI001C2D87A7|nr:DUF3833 domain-containing protein [Marinobacterium ramblicola]MBV1788170.1 DUF3833 domain-containing protein [Marinobacterium ramblicola]
MNIATRTITLLSLLTLASCGTNIEHYRNSQPALEPSTFFNGQLQAVGIVQNRSGEVTRRFTANIAAEWDGHRGVLDEQFQFNDGEEQWRCWRLEQQAGRLTGTAGDVVGEAEGTIAGNTLNWQYVLRVALDDGDSIDLSLDDWLYLVSEDHLINRTRMTKFGFDLGEITLSIHRISDTPTRPLRPSCRVKE